MKDSTPSEIMADLAIHFMSIETRVPSEPVVFDLKKQMQVAQESGMKLAKLIDDRTRNYNWSRTVAEASPELQGPLPYNTANCKSSKKQTFLARWFAQHAVKIQDKLADITPKIQGYAPATGKDGADEASTSTVKFAGKRKLSAYDCRLALVASWDAGAYTEQTLENQLRDSRDAESRANKRNVSRDDRLKADVGPDNHPPPTGTAKEQAQGRDRTYEKWFAVHSAKIEAKLSTIRVGV